jgi:hypothetical protein
MSLISCGYNGIGHARLLGMRCVEQLVEAIELSAKGYLMIGGRRRLRIKLAMQVKLEMAILARPLRARLRNCQVLI